MNNVDLKDASASKNLAISQQNLMCIDSVTDFLFMNVRQAGLSLCASIGLLESFPVPSPSFVQGWRHYGGFLSYHWTQIWNTWSLISCIIFFTNCTMAAIILSLYSWYHTSWLQLYGAIARPSILGNQLHPILNLQQSLLKGAANCSIAGHSSDSWERWGGGSSLDISDTFYLS